MYVGSHEWGGLRVRELRTRLGMSQTEFARKLSLLTGRNLIQERISLWESDEVRPSFPYVRALRSLDRITPPLNAVVGIDPALTEGLR